MKSSTNLTTIKIPENQVQRAILQFLTVHKIFCWRVNNGAMKIDKRYIKFVTDVNGDAVHGIPDICGVLPDGRALFIEVKNSTTLKMSLAQEEFITKADKNGAIAFVANSVDMVAEHLKGYGVKIK